MIKNIFFGLSLFVSAGVMAQFATLPAKTNNEGSTYKFTKIASLETTPVQSQGRTGTCWSFSALSFFESELIRMGNKNPGILSEMYIARKAYESKAEKYLRMDGKINFSEGGAFHDIPFVIRKYGIVPQEIYTGLVNGEETYNHGEMFNVLDGIMNGVLTQSKTRGATVSRTWKVAINAVLDGYMGPDPTEFTYEGKKYTPKSYANSLGLNMDDYVSLTSFTNFDEYSRCMLAIPDNWAWGESYNVPLPDLMTVVEEALKAGYTVAWGADVSEKGFSFKDGMGIAPEDQSTIKVTGSDNKNFSDGGADRTSNAFLEPVKEINVTPELRQEGYDNKSTTDDHGMHIVGIYKDQTGKKFLLVKNSWGTGNYPKGYLYVSENYFNWKTINIYLHKEGIPKGISKKLGLK
jgi:bleomycin hydrolase